MDLIAQRVRSIPDYGCWCGREWAIDARKRDLGRQRLCVNDVFWTMDPAFID